ncbi:MAG: hypothetical protein M0R05_05570 [Bacilli bacterium]|nr:hypothetical protein [Bacilli bacterium]MDD4076993.1 hypothetical protein [Bacilli bacterium]MDD4387938.1 hypothetical protein [Bacilli bacterium]
MKALIKCHFNYLINKATLYILILVIFISVFTFIVNCTALDFSSDYQENNVLYFQSTFLTVKTISVFLSIFLVCNIFSAKNDQYYYLITFYVSRIKYFITKLMAVFILEIIFVWMLSTAYQFVGFIFYPKYLFMRNSLFGYLNLSLLMIFYGLAALLFYQLVNNSYIIIVVFSLYIFSMIINEENNDVTSFFNSLFLYLDENGIFFFHWYYAIMLIFLLFAINLILYLSLDL